MEKIKIEGKRIYLYSHQIDMRMGMEKIQVLLSQNFSPSELQDSNLRFHIQKQEDSKGVRRGRIRPLADDQEVELHQLQDPACRRRRKADFQGCQISDGRSGNRIRKKADKIRMRTSFRKAEKGIKMS